MRNSKSLVFTLMILALMGCKTTQHISSKSNNSKMVDTKSAKKVSPFLINDSLTNIKKKWTLVFSDEFNDNQIDTTKWTV